MEAIADIIFVFGGSSECPAQLNLSGLFYQKRVRLLFSRRPPVLQSKAQTPQDHPVQTTSRDSTPVLPAYKALSSP